MGIKQVNELTTIDQIKYNDLVPIYDSTEVTDDKLKYIKVFNLIFPNFDLYRDGTFGFSLRNGVTVLSTTILAVPTVRVTPLDVLNCTYGNFPDPLIFGIRKSGSVTWEENADPSLAYIDFTSDDFESPHYIHIKIGTIWAETYVYPKAREGV